MNINYVENSINSSSRRTSCLNNKKRKKEMNRLTVLYLSGVLFAIFVPFTVSFPNSEKEVEPIPDGTTAASPVSVSKEPDHHLSMLQIDFK